MLGYFALRLVGGVVDALHQHAGEQEIREHHDAAVAELDRVIERRGDQREGDAGIGDLAPAEAHAFPQHAHDLGDVGVGVGIGGAAADDQQQRLGRAAIWRGECLRPSSMRSPAARSILQIDAELAAIGDAHPRMASPRRS